MLWNRKGVMWAFKVIMLDVRAFSGGMLDVGAFSIVCGQYLLV